MSNNNKTTQENNEEKISQKRVAQCFYEELIKEAGNKDSLNKLYRKKLDKWETDPKLSVPEKTITDVVIKNYNSHREYDDIIIKISVINQIYSTRVKTVDTFSFAWHIKDLEENNMLGKLIEDGNINAVYLIASSQEFNEKKIPKLEEEFKTRFSKMENHYSFATKYCSFHNENGFPIYDSYLREFVSVFCEETNGFEKISTKEIDNIEKFKTYYAEFCDRINKIIDYLKAKGLEEYTNKNSIKRELSYKTLDQFLWQGMKDCEKVMIDKKNKKEQDNENP